MEYETFEPVSTGIPRSSLSYLPPPEKAILTKSADIALSVLPATDTESFSLSSVRSDYFISQVVFNFTNVYGEQDVTNSIVHTITAKILVNEKTEVSFSFDYLPTVTTPEPISNTQTIDLSNPLIISNSDTLKIELGMSCSSTGREGSVSVEIICISMNLQR